MKPLLPSVIFTLIAVLAGGPAASSRAFETSPPSSARRGGESLPADLGWEDDGPMRFVSGSVALGGDDPLAGGECCSDGCQTCEPCWTFRGGALFLQRSNPSETRLAFFFDARPPLDASSFDFGTQAGWDIGAVRRLDAQHSLDARYFQVDGWSDNFVSSLVPGSFILFQNAGGAGVGFPHIVTASYESLLRSIELNVRRQQTDRLTLLAGFRYLNLRESLDLDQVDFFRYRTETHNHLFGAQIGADVLLADRGPFRLEGWLKAGLYGNSARSSLMATQDAPPLVFADFSAQRSRASFVGDLGLAASVRLNSHIVLRGGYQLLWIDGVALTSDQFAATDLPAEFVVTTSGGVFYHGALCGLEVTW